MIWFCEVFPQGVTHTFQTQKGRVDLGFIRLPVGWWWGGVCLLLGPDIYWLELVTV